MGIISLMLRPLKSFNIENRTFRILEKAKPTPAPKYKASEKELKQILKDNPNIVEEMSKKSIPLDNRLKDVYVSSVDPVEKHTLDKKNTKALPCDRSPPEDYEFGFKEPEHVLPGRLTLRGIFELFSVYENSNRKMDKKELAEKFNVSFESVELLLKYYGCFEMLETVKNKRTNKEYYLPITLWEGQHDKLKAEAEKLIK